MSVWTVRVPQGGGKLAWGLPMSGKTRLWVAMLDGKGGEGGRENGVTSGRETPWIECLGAAKARACMYLLHVQYLRMYCAVLGQSVCVRKDGRMAGCAGCLQESGRSSIDWPCSIYTIDVEGPEGRVDNAFKPERPLMLWRRVQAGWYIVG